MKHSSHKKELDKLSELYLKTASYILPNKYKYSDYSTEIIDLLEYFNENQIKRLIYNWKFKKLDIWNPSNILKDPFSFITWEDRLITFNKAEKIRTELNIKTNIATHTQAWIIHYFSSEGFYIEQWKIERKYIECFSKIYDKTVTNSTLRPLLKQYIPSHPTNKKITYYTTEYLINLEKSLGDNILDLYYDEESEIDEENIYEFIKRIEERIEMTLTEEQKQCVLDGIKYKLHIINGYPGTGKSTIMDVIIEYMVKELNFDPNTIFNLAPTGLAMKNLMSKCGSNINKQNGMTLHKFILYIQNLETSKNNGELILENDVSLSKTYKNKDGILTKKYYYIPKHINIDESSMMDIFIFQKIIKICKEYDCSLTLIGDYNQLSPVGLGTPFENIINSNIFQVNSLTIIKRQDGGIIANNIKLMAERCITENDFDNTTMKFLRTTDFSNKNINNIICENIDKGSKAIILSQKSNITNKYGWDIVNTSLQKLWNPKGKEISSWHKTKLHVKDTVIRTENEYDDHDVRVNGDVGTITHYENNEVTIEYLDDTEERITVKKLYDIFELFYASTVHKMQGGERDTIIIIIHPTHQYMWGKSLDRKKLLYTAISRAKKKCVIIGDYNLFLEAQKPIDDFQKPISLFMKKFNDYEF